MGTVALKQLPYPPTEDGYNYYDQITFSPGTPPDRPRPPIFGPDSPRPSHPIALPGDPWWGGGGPVDPGYSPPWAHVPVDPGYGHPGGGGGPGTKAVVIPLPPTNPPVTPPEGIPAGSVQVLIWFGRGTMPALAWVQPYASTGPVAPPSGGDTSV